MAIARIRPSRRVLAGLLLTAALFGPSGGAVPEAHANPVDDRFLAALQSRQISYKSAAAAIEAAHQVCAELDKGRTEADVAQEVMDRSGLDPYHAGYFVGASVGAYCPYHSND